MFDEKPPTPILQELLLHGLTLTLTAIAFVVSYLIWRNTFETIFFTIMPDRFVARFVYAFSQVAMAFVVLLVMLGGEIFLRRALGRGRLWPFYLKFLGALVVIGVLGLGIDRLLTAA
jgi:hypothetical protein